MSLPPYRHVRYAPATATPSVMGPILRDARVKAHSRRSGLRSGGAPGKARTWPLGRREVLETAVGECPVDIAASAARTGVAAGATDRRRLDAGDKGGMGRPWRSNALLAAWQAELTWWWLVLARRWRSTASRAIRRALALPRLSIDCSRRSWLWATTGFRHRPDRPVPGDAHRAEPTLNSDGSIEASINSGPSDGGPKTVYADGMVFRIWSWDSLSPAGKEGWMCLFASNYCRTHNLPIPDDLRNRCVGALFRWRDERQITLQDHPATPYHSSSPPNADYGEEPAPSKPRRYSGFTTAESRHHVLQWDRLSEKHKAALIYWMAVTYRLEAGRSVPRGMAKTMDKLIAEYEEDCSSQVIGYLREQYGSAPSSGAGP